MTATRILIVEDDAEIAAFLAEGLSAEGYDVTVRSDGRDLIALVAGGDFALVILDRMLPDTEGAALCRELRDAGEDLMVLMLTAKDALDDKLEGFRAGADDYLTKPFAFEELLARLTVLLRHSDKSVSRVDEVTLGGLHLDLALKTARHGDHDLGLTATEFALLKFLMENADRVASREDILRGVWQYEFDPHTNIVEVYMTYLRRKLERAGAAASIHTMRGFGYRLQIDGPPDHHD